MRSSHSHSEQSYLNPPSDGDSDGSADDLDAPCFARVFAGASAALLLAAGAIAWFFFVVHRVVVGVWPALWHTGLLLCIALACGAFTAAFVYHQRSRRTGVFLAALLTVAAILAATCAVVALTEGVDGRMEMVADTWTNGRNTKLVCQSEHTLRCSGWLALCNSTAPPDVAAGCPACAQRTRFARSCSHAVRQSLRGFVPAASAMCVALCLLLMFATGWLTWLLCTSRTPAGQWSSPSSMFL
jgi:hypothetical protein